jgi:chromosome partitioning protein
MKIVSITNQKGGVGKTTTAQCLAIGLYLKGKKVLLVDSDPQCNLSYTFNVLNQPNNLYTLLKGNCNINDAIINTENVDIIAGNKDLNNADSEFTKEPYISIGLQTLLKQQLDLIKNNYDYIIIDTPPTLGVLTLNALVSSNYAIIPMQADVYSIQGLAGLNDKINLIKRGLNPNLYVKGILLTKYNERTILNRDLKESIINATEQLNTKVFKNAIRESVAVREAQTKRTCVLLDQPHNNVSIDYIAFTDLILNEREDK